MRTTTTITHVTRDDVRVDTVALDTRSAIGDVAVRLGDVVTLYLTTDVAAHLAAQVRATLALIAVEEVAR